ncbi:hypothetical protein ACQ4M3_13135 [Leptolyngbya sp. AN03gr2]|uniref:hypothetical protein n=1 Tax=unclassified Leptolyngbya TaxID=2650499 RepID=UPI003D322551
MIPIPSNLYRSQADDKTPESDAAYFYFLRQRSLSDRIAMIQRLNLMAKKLAIASVQQTHPHIRESGQRQLVAQILLPDKYCGHFVLGGTFMSWEQQDSIGLTQQLHSLFTDLQIPYYLGGGLAAAIWGEPRVTQDADLILSFDPEQRTELIDRLIAELEQIGFYCPPGAVEEVRSRSGKTVSITHTQTVDNADLIAMPNEPFEHSQMQRRLLIETFGSPFWVCTAEDIILQKLVYSRQSRSEKQWRQVLGVLKAQSNQLDFEYLNRWGEQLNLSDRLRQSYEESGVTS